MRASVLTLAILVAGCAAGVPVQRQVVVPGDRFANVQGEAALFVRTFLAPEARGERQEVVGARCQVRSSIYSAELVTPSRLVVPNFGPQSPELDVSCAAGEWRGTGRVEIITRWNEPPGYWGYPGPYFPGWAPYGPGWGWYGPAYPVSDYPNLNIQLR
jgi:hypothetical protein